MVLNHAFLDEAGKIVMESELYEDFQNMKKEDPEEYGYSFTDYVRECTGKNGTLKQIF